jgi:hypothetical protein
MIKVKDTYNILPRIFELASIEKNNDVYDIEILPGGQYQLPDLNVVSNQLTLFLYQEPLSNNLSELEYDRRQRPNHVYASSVLGKVNNLNSVFLPVWMFDTADVNQLLEYKNTYPKKFLADILLGGTTPNRQKFMRKLKDLNLVELCLVSYHIRNENTGIDDNDLFEYRSKELDQLDNKDFLDLAFTDNKIQTMVPMSNTFGKLNFLSQYIPSNVYNTSYLSVVFETENISQENQIVITEKLSKPIIAGRPFLLFAPQGTLSTLRSIGFKTFSPWIDESYDAVQDTTLRIEKIIESLIKFDQIKNKQQVIKELDMISKHNQDLVLNSNKLFTPLLNILTQKIGNK